MLASNRQRRSRSTSSVIHTRIVADCFIRPSKNRIREAVVACAGQMRALRLLPLFLTIDRRAVTGGEAARFLAALLADLGLPD